MDRRAYREDGERDPWSQGDGDLDELPRVVPHGYAPRSSRVNGRHGPRTKQLVPAQATHAAAARTATCAVPQRSQTSGPTDAGERLSPAASVVAIAVMTPALRSGETGAMGARLHPAVERACTRRCAADRPAGEMHAQAHGDRSPAERGWSDSQRR